MTQQRSHHRTDRPVAVETAASQPERAERQVSGLRALPLIAISLGYFMVILDATIVTVALPALGRDLGSNVAGLQWVVDAYTATLAGLLLLGGSLGDRFGSRKVFQAALVGFTLASLACGLAPSLGWLIAARAVQGVGAAMAVPSSLALLRAAYPGARERARVRRLGRHRRHCGGQRAGARRRADRVDLVAGGVHGQPADRPAGAVADVATRAGGPAPRRRLGDRPGRAGRGRGEPRRADPRAHPAAARPAGPSRWWPAGWPPSRSSASPGC